MAGINLQSLSTSTPGVTRWESSRLEVSQRSGQDRRLGGWVVDDLDIYLGLNRGVVAGRHPERWIFARVGVDRRRDVHIIRNHCEQRPRTLGERSPYRVGSREMQLQGVLTVEDEVRRDDNRQVSVRSSWRDELSEVELVQHRPPLVVMAWGVPRVHQHDRHPASPILVPCSLPTFIRAASGAPVTNGAQLSRLPIRLAAAA